MPGGGSGDGGGGRGDDASGAKRGGDGRQRVLAAAVASRLVFCTLMALSDVLIPDWDDGDPTVAHFAAPSGLRAFARWDAAWFLRVAQDGYTDEQSHFVFPGLPWIIRLLAPATLSQGAGLVVVGVMITNISFVGSALVLYELGRHVGLDSHLAETAALLYCFGPASVFHSSVYSESPFALCTFGGLLLLSAGRRGAAAAVFAVGTSFRSNGIVNAGFLACDALFHGVVRQPRVRLGPLLAGAACAVLVLLPYVAFEAYGFAKFCGPPPQGGARPAWCEKRVPSLYGHLQRTYWGVGLFARWELKQLPAFIIAAPSLIVAFTWASAFFREVRARGPRAWLLDPGSSGLFGPALLPHAVQVAFLATVALLVMHVQVAPRFLSAAAPSFHWWLASLWRQRRYRAAVQGFLGLFAFLGIVLHPNRLPWT